MFGAKTQQWRERQNSRKKQGAAEEEESTGAGAHDGKIENGRIIRIKHAQRLRDCQPLMWSLEVNFGYLSTLSLRFILFITLAIVANLEARGREAVSQRDTRDD